MYPISLPHKVLFCMICRDVEYDQASKAIASVLDNGAEIHLQRARGDVTTVPPLRARAFEFAFNANFPFTGFIDPDDWLEEGAVEKAVSLFTSYPDVDIVGMKQKIPGREQPETHELIFNPHFYTFHGFVLYRTEVLIEYLHLLKTSVSPAWHFDLLKQMTQHSSSLYLDTYGYVYNKG